MQQDLGNFNVGFHNKQQRSPHVDKLKSEGVELAAHYTFSFCSPTRSSVLSGRLPMHVNQGNPQGMRMHADGGVGGIDLRMTLLPEKLKTRYRTRAAVGKW